MIRQCNSCLKQYRVVNIEISTCPDCILYPKAKRIQDRQPYVRPLKTVGRNATVVTAKELVCNKCKTLKPIDKFVIKNRKVHNDCKECRQIVKPKTKAKLEYSNCVTCNKSKPGHCFKRGNKQPSLNCQSCDNKMRNKSTA